MKCRLYPNKKVAEGFDKAIQAIHCYHNCLLYDIFNGNIESTAKSYKPKKESKPEKKKDESDFDISNVFTLMSKNKSTKMAIQFISRI